MRQLVKLWKRPSYDGKRFTCYLLYTDEQGKRRQKSLGHADARLKVVNNFTRDFRKILRRTGIKRGQFHDLHRTALSNWFANGMSENDVMTLAGHASFATTHEFYLAVADDLMDRARQAASQAMSKICCKSVAGAF